MEDPERGLYGVQFHPEVTHTGRGQDILKRFLYDVCGLAPSWTSHSIIEQSVDRIRDQVGDGKVVCGLSGGVDSAVAAALVHRAVGDQLTCIFVDHGLLREAEADQVDETFRRHFQTNLIQVKAADRFLEKLAGCHRSRGQAQGHRGKRSSGYSRKWQATCRMPDSWFREPSIPM